MNIFQLLSVTPTSPQMQSQGALSVQEAPDGFFRQALLQASVAQASHLPSPELQAHVSHALPAGIASEAGFSQTSLLQDALSALPEAVDLDSESLRDVLETMGIEASEQDMPALLAQLQSLSVNQGIETPAQDNVATLTPLNEISARLTLISSFADHTSPLLTGSPTEVEASEERLNAAQAETALPINLAAIQNIFKSINIETAEPLGSVNLETLETLETIAEYLQVDPQGSVQLVESSSLEIIAERLDINQSEAAQLISALSVVMDQNRGSQTLSVTPPSLVSTGAPPSAINTPQQPQVDNLFTRISPVSPSPQISSEALLGALSAMENAPKQNVASESLPTGLALGTNQPPLASAQPNVTLAPTSAPPQATLTAPVTSNAWPQQLGQQLVQISQRGGDQHVQMKLNPAELGPLSISLKFSEQGAQAHFLSASAQVRQVLEQAIPQLREALAEQGISLGDTSVGEQRDPNAQAFAQSGNQQGAGIGSGDSDATSEETAGAASEGTPLILDGRVDLYA